MKKMKILIFVSVLLGAFLFILACQNSNNPNTPAPTGTIAANLIGGNCGVTFLLNKVTPVAVTVTGNYNGIIYTNIPTDVSPNYHVLVFESANNTTVTCAVTVTGAAQTFSASGVCTPGALSISCP